MSAGHTPGPAAINAAAEIQMYLDANRHHSAPLSRDVIAHTIERVCAVSELLAALKFALSDLELAANSRQGGSIGLHPATFHGARAAILKAEGGK